MVSALARSAFFGVLVANGFSSPVLADSLLAKGNLSIKRWDQGYCASPSMKSGSYHVKAGVSGVLYVKDCKPNSDAPVTYNFVDVSGKERCTGRMRVDHVFGTDDISSIWYIDGTARGSKCSMVGRVFRIEKMKYLSFSSDK